MTSSSEKFCLKWNDFEQNIITSYYDMRKDPEFCDVTLVGEGDQQIEAHKVILSSCSPFFRSVLKRNKHSHPLIYMRGIAAKDLVSIVDFIYHGEANIYQEDLDGFLALAEEFQLKGLAGSQESPLGTANDPYEEPMQPKPQRRVTPTFEKFNQSPDHGAYESSPNTNVNNSQMVPVDSGKILVAADTSMEDLKVKLDSMMEEHSDGEYKWKCTVCGKATKGNDARDMRRHIETHMEGLSYPCNQCGQISRLSNALKCNMTWYHTKKLN